MKDSFILYTSYADKLSVLNDEQLGKLIRVIFEYEKTQHNLEKPLDDPLVEMAFMFIKADLDRNFDKYNTSKENGKRGGRPKKEKPSETQQNPTKPNYNLICNMLDVKCNSKEKENIKEKENSFSLPTPEKQKHKHGNYGHVLLTDEEKQKLEHDYGADKAQEAIAYLDEYIEYKGYKANSHYLAIRKWVFKALEEHSRDKPGASEMPVYDDSNNPKFTDEDYETLLKELGHGG